MIVIIIILFVVFLIWKFYENKKKENYESGKMSPEEKIKYEESLQKRMKYKQLLQKITINPKKQKTIKQVMILTNSTDSRKKVGSTIIRGAIGGATLGAAGLLGGALSGKNKTTTTTTFLIEYEDGHKETKIVKNNSKEFKKLCQYIKIK